MEVIRKPEKIIECTNYSAGKKVVGRGPKRSVLSPYFGEIVGRFHDSTKDDVDATMQNAIIAQKDWALTPIKERSQIMFEFRNVLLRRLPEAI